MREIIFATIMALSVFQFNPALAEETYQLLGVIETDSNALPPQRIFARVNEKSELIGLKLEDPKGIRYFNASDLAKEDTVLKTKPTKLGVQVPVVKGRLDHFNATHGGVLAISFRQSYSGFTWIEKKIPLKPDETGVWRGWNGDHYGQRLQVLLKGETFPQELVFN